MLVMNDDDMLMMQQLRSDTVDARFIYLFIYLSIASSFFLLAILGHEFFACLFHFSSSAISISTILCKANFIIMAGPPPIPSKTRPSFTNPFYRNSNASSSSTASSPPPSYGTHSSHSTQPPRPSSTQQFEPVQYSSLSSLTKNQPKHTHTSQPASYEYQPDPSRQGYSTRGFELQGQAVNENVNAGRRLPPMPGQGQSRTGTPTEPPQRAIHSGKQMSPSDKEKIVAHLLGQLQRRLHHRPEQDLDFKVTFLVELSLDSTRPPRALEAQQIR